MKTELLKRILEKLSETLNATKSAANAAVEAATGPDSKAENQYDTRGLEASYLAGAQMKRVEELQRQIAFYQTLQNASVAIGKATIGSLVETDRAFYLLVPEAGGTSVEVDGCTVNVITPHSPLGEALVGAMAGEVVEFENGGTSRQVRVKKIY